MTAFGNAMRQLRLNADPKLSIRKAAALVPISDSYWLRLETGANSNPSRAVAEAIDTAFDQGGRFVALLEQGDEEPLGLLLRSPSPGGPLTSEDVAGMYETVRELIRLDQQFGADELHTLGLRAWRSANDRIAAGQVTAGIVADARRAAAELAQVCGWLAYDADRQDLARAMFNEALVGAELVGDWGLETFIRDLRAMQDLHVGRPQDALLMARRAVDHPRVTGRMEAIFRLREGRALAALGAPAEALDALARSRAALAGGMTSKDSPWTWWIHEAEVCLHESLALSALGMHAKACETSQRSMELLPQTQVRDAAVYQAYRVDVLVAAGAADDAVAELGALGRQWPAVSSSRTANLVTAAAARSTATDAVRAAARECLAASP